MIERGDETMRMGFAVNTFYNGDPKEIREMMQLGPDAEQAGFDSVWIGDHVLWHTPIVDGLTLLASFASTTEKVSLGTGIFLLGLRQPYIATKMITSLNALSGGDRLIMGFGVGGENPKEFEVAGVSHERRGKLLDEGLDILLDQWEEDPKGPLLEPIGQRPKILIGGRSNASRRRIVKFDAGWLAAFVSAKRVAEENELLATQLGHAPETALHAYYNIDEDEDRARREAGKFLGYVYAMDEEPLMRYTIAGSAESCAEQVSKYWDAGVRQFCLRPATWDQRTQLDRLAGDLVPRLSA